MTEGRGSGGQAAMLRDELDSLQVSCSYTRP